MAESKNIISLGDVAVTSIKSNELVLFKTDDEQIILPVKIVSETVWLNRRQIADLFGRDIKTIGKHIGNALDDELADF